jgi:hypothetical protein
MLLHLFRSPSEAAGRAGSPPVVLALVEREGSRATGGSTGLLRVRLDPRVAIRSSFKYEARSVGDLVDRIVPHFEAYPLRGAKRRSFDGFAQACQMIGQGDHLRPEGMREIVRIAYEMNLGKRRHSASTLLRTLSEVKG